MNKTFAAISIFVGTTIGAGILGIPHVAMKAGFPIAILHLLILGSIMILTNLYLGEIALRTKKDHQLTGYAEKYLGKKGKILMFIAFSFGIYTSLIGYLIGEANSLSQVFLNNTSQTLFLGIIFWILLSAMSFYSLRFFEKGETFGVLMILLLVVGISIVAWNSIDPDNLTYINPENSLLPFGVILFSLMGFAAMPEVERVLKNQKGKTQFVLAASYTIIILTYALFTAVVLGFKGSLTPQIATLVLGKPFIIFGMITMFTSYLGISVAQMSVYKLDYGFSHKKAWIATVLPPITIFILLELTNLSSFTKVIGVSGVITGGLTAILAMLMVKNAKRFGDRKPEYSLPCPKFLTAILIIVFIAGAAAEIFL